MEHQGDVTVGQGRPSIRSASTTTAHAAARPSPAPRPAPGDLSRRFSAAQRAAALAAADALVPHRPDEEEAAEEGGVDVDWGRVSLFGTGLALGLAVGASVALLTTPQSGAETRAFLRRKTRRLGVRGLDAWDDLRDELSSAARRGRKRVRKAWRERREGREC